MVTLIVADGDLPDRARLDAVWPDWEAGISEVIAADGGARHAARLGLSIDLWVGDADSLGEDGLAALVASGVPIERSRPDKDVSDTELAIDAAIRRGAASIVIVGALGGSRIDHALANINLLARPDLLGRASILDGRSKLTCVGFVGPGDETAHLDLVGGPGDLVSLQPVDAEVDGVTTDGLVYVLADEPLRLGSTRGLSNVIARHGARVSVRTGRLLVIESPASL